MLAALNQPWTDLPTDPRASLTGKIHAARARKDDADALALAANGNLNDLARQQGDQRRESDAAEESLSRIAETRRLLAPAITAASVLAKTRPQLPRFLQALAEAARRENELGQRKPDLAARVEAARDLAGESRRRRDDAAEALRAAGLSAIAEGPLPAEDETAIRARLRRRPRGAERQGH
jgi:hypothetical protein